MAFILAAQNGNFHATSTWIGGVVPGVGDVAYANNRTVTITANVTCDKLSTRADNGATAGGSFTVAAGSTGLTITAAVEAGTTTCLTSNLTSGQTLTVDASVGGVVAGSSSNAYGVNNASSGTLNITGNCTGGSGNDSRGANNASSGTINITGNCTGGSNGFGLAFGACNASAGTVTIAGNCAALNNSTGASNLSTGNLIISGNCIGGNYTFTPIYGANNASTGTLTITGNCIGGGATNNFGANNASSGTVAITGNCTGGSVASGANNAASGSMTITGNCTGGSIGAIGANNAAAGVLTITGIAYGSSTSSAQGANNASTGTMRVTRAVGNPFGIGAVTVNPGVGVTSSNVQSLTYVQELEFGTRGATPTSGPIYLTGAISNVVDFALEGGGRKVLVDAAATAGVLPAASDVRSGTVYSSGNLTGTLAVPAAGSVALGVPVGNTTGTAVLTQANVRTALGMASANLDTQLAAIPSAATIASTVWAAGTRTLTTAIDNSATIAAAVWAYATGRTITGGTVDTLTNAPSVPSAATIASQVRTELSTELGRIDVATSSRLAASSYSAAPSAATNATAVRSELATELGRIDATVSSRLAPGGTLARVTLTDTATTLTNAPTVPSAAEISAEVWSTSVREVTGGTVDNVTNSTPVDATEIAEAVRTELTPELARVANAATTQEVGDIVEEAMQP